MIGHDYMIVSLYGFMVFTTSHKTSVVINVICDCPSWLHDIFNIQNLIIIYLINVLSPHGNLGWVQDFINHLWVDT
jgi:hypothetical protein